MKHLRDKSTIYIRLDKGDEVLESIKAVCKVENITGYFQGIGACSEVTIGTYIAEKRDYLDHIVGGLLEMISLSGNTTSAANDEVGIHAHASFSYLGENNKVKLIGGHLKSARISYTAEITLTISDQKLTRRYDPEVGINVWDIK